ncbi:MAG: histidine kinase [Bacteroidota bacterium]
MVKVFSNIGGNVRFTDLMIFRNRWWQHLIFWGVSLFVLLNIFNTSSSLEKIDVIYSLIFLAPISGMVYLNLYLAVPGLLRKERYLLYVLIFLILTGGAALFLYFLFDSLIDLILPNYYFISYYNVPILMLFTGAFLLLTTLLKLSRSWFMLLRVERMSTNHQLKSLQSQINPHFLLNSLQTIYALSLEKSDHTPKVILQLADILKYTLYETAQDRVMLRKELDMIKDYVEIHRLRIDPGRAEIVLDIKGESGEAMIAPMLLIPFVENSFKHGLQGSPLHAFVHIHINITPGRFLFHIENNLGNMDPISQEEKKGIGIDNTRQRLELLYQGKYKLAIGSKERTFEVKLELDLND